MPAVMEERRPAGVHPSPVVVGPVDAPVAAAVIPAAPPVAAKKKKPVLLFVFLALIVVASSVGIYEFIYFSHYVTTDDAFIEGHVVSISPQVPAKIKSVLIDDNMFVHKGQLMVELDPTDYLIAVNQAKATENAMAGKSKEADAEIQSAMASLDEADAEVAVATANLTNSKADLDRYTELQKRDPGAVSKQQFDAATAAQASNAAQVRQAEAKKKQYEADVETKKATAEAAKGDLLKATADVNKAETNLSYCNIVAPEDGRVTRKNVEPGSYTQAGEQLFAIVPSNVWVVANFKETQLSRMKIGDDVEVEVDAYPGMKLHGHVDTFQYGTGSRFSVLPAENATGNFVKVVQRLPTKIVLDNVPNDPNRPLALGMSVEPEVTLK
jgi:membrane fusion protein (multidrug efflux system)